jgi:hypothetical protein
MSASEYERRTMSNNKPKNLVLKISVLLLLFLLLLFEFKIMDSSSLSQTCYFCE